jgi:hypothetical protein
MNPFQQLYLHATAPELPTESGSISPTSAPVKLEPSAPSGGSEPSTPPIIDNTPLEPAPLEPAPLEPAPLEPTQIINISYDQTPPIGDIVDGINYDNDYGGGGGGGGGFGMPPSDDGEAPPPPKKTLIPLVLIAVGAFFLLKKPLK